MTAGDAAAVIESVESRPWASLTFSGERHRLIVRLPAAERDDDIDGNDLIVSGSIIAVDRARWEADDRGAILTLDVLAIADPASLPRV